VSIDPQVRDILLIVVVALSAVAVLLSVVALRKGGRLRRDLLLLQAGDDGVSFLASAARQAEQVAALSAQVGELNRSLERTRSELADALRHVSVVRYDAFSDMGGRLSFSAALLDDGGDGLVLTSIHARSETRSYVKGVKGGGADTQLSPEEQEAVTHALSGGRG
jgi:hypothetical protein